MSLIAQQVIANNLNLDPEDVAIHPRGDHFIVYAKIRGKKYSAYVDKQDLNCYVYKPKCSTQLEFERVRTFGVRNRRHRRKRSKSKSRKRSKKHVNKSRRKSRR